MPTLSSLPRGAYILDKDGTLVDTESLWIETLGDVMRGRGLPYDLTIHAKIMGGGIGPAVRSFQGMFPALPQGPEAAMVLEQEIWRKYGERKALDGVRLNPGVRAFLEQCRATGIPLALATSSPRRDMEDDVDRLHIRSFFHAMVAGDEVSRLKPAPDMYVEAAKRLGVSPTDCTAFEDAPNGIQSAHAAGMAVVFIRDPRFEFPAYPEASLTVDGFEELLAG